MRGLVAVVVIIVLLVIYHRETFAGGMVAAANVPAGGISIAVADVALPAHNSGKPSLWVPDGMRPEYYWRRVVWTE